MQERNYTQSLNLGGTLSSKQGSLFPPLSTDLTTTPVRPPRTNLRKPSLVCLSTTPSQPARSIPSQIASTTKGVPVLCLPPTIHLHHEHLSNQTFRISMDPTPWDGFSKSRNCLSIRAHQKRSTLPQLLSTWTVPRSVGTNGCSEMVSSHPGSASFRLWSRASHPRTMTIPRVPCSSWPKPAL